MLSFRIGWKAGSRFLLDRSDWCHEKLCSNYYCVTELQYEDKLYIFQDVPLTWPILAWCFRDHILLILELPPAGFFNALIYADASFPVKA
jgi:hypothetical protein